MKMAKADPAGIKLVNEFVHDLESAVERGEYPSGDIERPEKDASDERLGRFVREFWRRQRGDLFRVTFGYQVLVDNCCDPNATTLEWKPEIAARLAVVPETPPTETPPTERTP
jgi:hypothetical protein